MFGFVVIFCLFIHLLFVCVVVVAFVWFLLCGLCLFGLFLCFVWLFVCFFVVFFTKVNGKDIQNYINTAITFNFHLFGIRTYDCICVLYMLSSHDFLPFCQIQQLVHMSTEGLYLDDDRDTYYAESVIMPPSYKSKTNSVIYVNSQGIYQEPITIGDPCTLFLLQGQRKK